MWRPACGTWISTRRQSANTQRAVWVLCRLIRVGGSRAPNVPERLFPDDFLDPPDLELKAAAGWGRVRGLQPSACKHWEHTLGSAVEPSGLLTWTRTVTFCSWKNAETEPRIVSPKVIHHSVTRSHRAHKSPRRLTSVLKVTFRHWSRAGSAEPSCCFSQCFWESVKFSLQLLCLSVNV